MIRRSLVRALMTSVALSAGALLAGCNSDEIGSLATNAKANQPVPPKLIAAMVEKNMDLQSPILIRLFKQEAELEVWKQDRTGRFALLKTYPICRWSGDLGPKVREGDRQAPEGFYAITPAQMNPTSAYYLSFNTGYPNAYDRSLGHTGSELMVHGDCSSRGCYAMTDEQIAEIYALGRESFFGGQKSFQFQAYPFHMTALNMARHRNSPHMAFWKMIKEGNDHFEVTKQEPKVDFCEKKYVFDAVKAPDAKRDPVFEASSKCPAYVVPQEVADAVREKQAADDAEFAKLVSKGTPMAQLNTGIDGGMHRVFAARVPNGNTGLSEAGPTPSVFNPPERAPGTIPLDHVNPPRGSVTSPDDPLTASLSSSSTRVAAAPSGESEGFFSSLSRAFAGSASADATTATTPPPPTPAKPKVADVKPRLEAAKPAKETKQASAKPAAKPAATETAAATPAPAAAPAASQPATSLVAGAQPIVSSNSFDSRFSAAK
ncbi:MAG TPA: murein L,D-transpeptidase family protein [Bradyrhizobium sp.]|uniref:murein L,D-transpeptidase family protein n=1 Tax=Bradyrhizobium sp. TaxID=376 RepID=UPI002D8010BD|nr:murein L,D-transpeptidase family protein [Bradyrhizobium sp.]HET7889294.1 murein L,D-transpeptidase family protein [Bradyrhizobium sp.]